MLSFLFQTEVIVFEMFVGLSWHIFYYYVMIMKKKPIKILKFSECQATILPLQISWVQ